MALAIATLHLDVVHAAGSTGPETSLLDFCHWERVRPRSYYVGFYLWSCAVRGYIAGGKRCLMDWSHNRIKGTQRFATVDIKAIYTYATSDHETGYLH